MRLQVQQVARIWADVIGIREADVETNFFDLGGHSLLLADLAYSLSQQMNIDTDVLTLIEYPTIASFTAYWNGEHAAADSATADDGP